MIKKTLLSYTFFGGILALNTMAFADNGQFVKPGSVACITSKMMQKYNEYQSQDQQAPMEDLMDRASCYYEYTNKPVAVVSEMLGLVKVQRASGHTVWMDKESIE